MVVSLQKNQMIINCLFNNICFSFKLFVINEKKYFEYPRLAFKNDNLNSMSYTPKNEFKMFLM